MGMSSKWAFGFVRLQRIPPPQIFLPHDTCGIRLEWQKADSNPPWSRGQMREMTTLTPEPYVTADDVAEHLKITRRQVLEMTRKGVIPAYPLGVGQYRRVWRFKISEVDAAIASGTRKPSATNEDRVLAEMPARRTMPVGSPRSQKGKL
jgi:excisionase family DNA binding protein